MPSTIYDSREILQEIIEKQAAKSGKTQKHQISMLQPSHDNSFLDIFAMPRLIKARCVCVNKCQGTIYVPEKRVREDGNNLVTLHEISNEKG